MPRRDGEARRHPLRTTPPFRGALLPNGGTGIPRQFYAAFAAHLAGRGFTVLSYDYRGGIGGSEKPGAATIDQWGSIDQPSMLDHLAELCPGAPLGIVGHSFGGQVLGLADNISSVRAGRADHQPERPLAALAGLAGGCACLALWWLLILALRH